MRQTTTKSKRSGHRISKTKFIASLSVGIALGVVAIIIVIIFSYQPPATPFTNLPNTPSGISIEASSVVYYATSYDTIDAAIGEQDLAMLNIATSEDDFISLIKYYDSITDLDDEYFSQKDAINDYARDFTSHNYLIMGYTDHCNRDLSVSAAYLDGSRLSLFITNYHQCGFCAPSGNLFIVEIPKNITTLNQIVYDVTDKDETCDPSLEY